MCGLITCIRSRFGFRVFLLRCAMLIAPKVGLAIVARVPHPISQWFTCIVAQLLLVAPAAAPSFLIRRAGHCSGENE